MRVGRQSLTAAARVALLGVYAASLSLGSSIYSRATAESPQRAWRFEGKSGAVSTWTSEKGLSSIGSFKVSAVFGVPPAAFVAVLRDIPGYPRWYRDCAQTRVLGKPAKVEPVALDAAGRFAQGSVGESYLLLFVQHVSMISDRFAVIESTARVTADGSLELAFQSRDRDPRVGPPGAKRMGLSGMWLIAPFDRTHTQVTCVVDLDLRTSLPDFLVAPRVREAAEQTLLALGRVAAGRAR